MDTILFFFCFLTPTSHSSPLPTASSRASWGSQKYTPVKTMQRSPVLLTLALLTCSSLLSKLPSSSFFFSCVIPLLLNVGQRRSPPSLRVWQDMLLGVSSYST